MRKYLVLILIFLWPNIVFAATGGMYDIGPVQLYDTANLYFVDTIYADQGASASGTCDGTPDWGGGGLVESFERGADQFCNADWTLQDNSTVISTYDDAQAKIGSYSASVIHDSDNGDDDYIHATFNSSQTSVYLGGWWKVPTFTNTATMMIVNTEDASSNDIDLVGCDKDGFATICFTDDCATDSFLVTEGEWVFISLHSQKNGTSTLKVYDDEGALLDCVDGGDDPDNVCNTGTDEITRTGGNFDIVRMQILADSSGTVAHTSYYDGWEYSTSAEVTP